MSILINPIYLTNIRYNFYDEITECAVFLWLFTACHSQNSSIVNLNAEDFKAAFEMEGGLLVDVRTHQEVQRGRLEDANVINFYDSNFDKKLPNYRKGNPYLCIVKAEAEVPKRRVN